MNKTQQIILIFLIALIYGCSYEELKQLSEKEINITDEQLKEIAEKRTPQYERGEPTKAFCGNNVCEYYRITLGEEAGRESGGAIFLNNVFHKIKLDLVDTANSASICVDKKCDSVELRNTKNINDIDVFAEQINYSAQYGASQITLTFGENSQTCANDCQGITGYCGDNVCNAKEVKLNVGEEKEVQIDGALLKIKLKELKKDAYWLEIKGPDGIRSEGGSQGIGSFGFGQSIPRLRKGFNPLDLFIISYGGPSEMVDIKYSVTELTGESVTLVIGDESGNDPDICYDCYTEMKSLAMPSNCQQIIKGREQTIICNQNQSEDN